ncbi:hypothetical protein GC174_10805 [bacterium]|nr:hypothetical protein [bacterium]
MTSPKSTPAKTGVPARLSRLRFLDLLLLFLEEGAAASATSVVTAAPSSGFDSALRLTPQLMQVS